MKPPRGARVLLRWTVPAEQRDEVLGDLAEVHRQRRTRLGRARAWWATTWEAVGIAGAFTAQRAREARIPVSWAELRRSVRLMMRQPTLTLTALLALTTAIGLSTTGYALAEAFLFSDLPFEGGDRIALLRAYTPEGDRAPVDLERYETFRRQASRLDHVGALEIATFNVAFGPDDVESLEGAWITPGLAAHLPHTPLLGRPLQPGDGDPGAEAVAVIREDLWNRRFGADPDVVGRAITVSGERRTIVGVLPADARFPDDGALWLPIGERFLGGDASGPRGGVTLVAVVAAGVDFEAAEEQLVTLAARAPGADGAAAPVRIRLVPLTDAMDGALIYVLMSALITVLVLVLLVVAANIGNLIYARTAARTQELAVRTALGAGRARLVGQLFGEVLVMGGAAALLGLTVAGEVLRRIDGAAEDLPYWIRFELSPGAVAFMVSVTLLATAVCGLLPALRATRRDPAAVLQSGGRGFQSGGLGRLGATMVVLQMAVSVALLGVAFITGQGFAGYVGTPDRIDGSDAAVVNLYLPRPDLADDIEAVDSLTRIRTALVEEISGIDGVRSMTIGTHLPRVEAARTRVAVTGAGGVAAQEPAGRVAAGPGFLEGLGLTAAVGRGLGPADHEAGAAPVAVVNQAFAARFGGSGAVGQAFEVVGSGPGGAVSEAPYRIVGIVDDTGFGPDQGPRAARYFVPLTDEGFAYGLVRADRSAAELEPRIRAAITRVLPTAQIGRIRPLADVGEENRRGMLMIGAGLFALGAVAMVLSVVGLYALMSFTVTRRTREIGVRRALGASPGEVFRALGRRAVIQITTGALLGTGLGILLIQARTIFTFEVPSTEYVVIPAVAGALVLVGLAALAAPTLRALRIRPVEALEAE
ncbi:MAG: FtsX-like permease family protein [Longimicrobiales bacterium]